MFRSLVFVVLTVGSVCAQQAPYDQAPPVEAPYSRVRMEASSRSGELIFPVQYTVWIPPEVGTLRGLVVHQHGCGEGSCRSGQTGAFDLHWQALARQHDCALLSPSYEEPEGADCQMWCDPRNGSGKAFLQALEILGQEAGHPELAAVPWALWGHSGGGHWVGGMTLLYPDRVAAAWLRSGVPYLQPNPDRPSIMPHAFPKAAVSVPMMCNLGTKEGVTVKDGRFSSVWPSNETFFRFVRSRGGLIGVAVDPLSSHECGNQRYLAIPWLDHCLGMRLPERWNMGLRPMKSENAWVAPLLGSKASALNRFDGNPLEALWLPSETMARLWEHYVRDTNVPDATAPPAPTQIHVKGDVMTWTAEADLESGLAAFIVRVKGREIARIPSEVNNRYGRSLFQGLQYSDTPTTPLVSMQFVSSEVGDANGADVEVIAVNTVGLTSE